MGVHLSWFFVKKKRNRGELCAKGRSPRGPPPGTASTPRQGQAGAIHTSARRCCTCTPPPTSAPDHHSLLRLCRAPHASRWWWAPCRSGSGPVLRFRGAAPAPGARGAGAPTRVFRLAARADTRGVGWGDPGPGASRAGLAGGCSSRGTNPARDIGPALAPMPRPSAAASIPFGAFTAARRSRCRLRLSVSGDRGLLPAGLDR